MAFANLVAKSTEKRLRAEQEKHLAHSLQASALDRQLRGFSEEEQSTGSENFPSFKNGAARGKTKGSVSRGFNADMKKEFSALNKDLDDFEAKLFGGLDADFDEPTKTAPQTQLVPQTSAPVYARVQPGMAAAHNFTATKIEVNLPTAGQEYQPGKIFQPPARQHAPVFLVSDDPPQPLRPAFIPSGQSEWDSDRTLPIDRLLASLPQPPPPPSTSTVSDDMFAPASSIPSYSEDMFARPSGHGGDLLAGRGGPLNLGASATKYHVNDEEELDEDELNDPDLARDLENLRLGPSFGSIDDLKQAARMARKSARQRRMQLGNTQRWHEPIHPDTQTPWQYEEPAPQQVPDTYYMF